MPSVTQDSKTVAPRYGTALSMLFLREQLADSAAWKALVASPLIDSSAFQALADADTSSRANALAAIKLFGFRGNASSTAARSFIRPLQETDIETFALSSSDVSGMFLMCLELPIPTNYRGPNLIELAGTDFMDKVGQIVSELNIGAPEAERLFITRVGYGPLGFLSNDDHNGVYAMSIELLVRYQGDY